MNCLFDWLLTLCLPCLQKCDHKNIRRRVYDALNVLMAMDIIEKEKKEIKWLGLPVEVTNESRMYEVRRAPTI